MRTLETDRHRLSPSCITVGRRERSYRKAAQMKIATVPIYQLVLLYQHGRHLPVGKGIKPLLRAA
jgi:hypothetical protein